ncbi:hypothetical protein HUG10_15040 [Halorarum halophilum]|uniref:DUF8054 domain-containing protein n=1 Tax=Halorarum halophilum TaxID=2743090 RepID=A0A7D5K968_9EURY|nr:hypothetical protein [Halobaculum halophilum]QLG28774.1 hypothetical protein HUG10_15040 [Halobaculum halophilum]
MSDGPLGAAPAPVSLPRGDLLAARVVADVGEPLRDALDRELTGYLVLEPGTTLLLDVAERGVITLADGVPVLAYELDSDAGGPAALAALAGAGPVRASSYRLSAPEIATVHDCDPLQVAPGGPARELADDPELAARTRERAPDGRRGEGGDHDALAAFLADEERVAAIKREAREEAERRAAEWGLAGELADDGRVD